MYAAIRTYSGRDAKKLFDFLKSKRPTSRRPCAKYLASPATHCCLSVMAVYR